MLSLSLPPIKLLQGAHVATLSEIAALTATTLASSLAELTATEIATQIQKRERLGDTYIGQRTVIMHLESPRVLQNWCVFIEPTTALQWTSQYSHVTYTVEHIIVLAVSSTTMQGTATIRQVMQALGEPNFLTSLPSVTTPEAMAAKFTPFLVEGDKRS
jgi:mannitol/fructose-specific phosphotransferase system IIA component (Ntr-type)